MMTDEDGTHMRDGMLRCLQPGVSMAFFILSFTWDEKTGGTHAQPKARGREDRQQ